MNIQAPTKTHLSEGLSLEQVAHSTKLTEREKITELSKGFEAVLLRNVLENAQKPTLDKKSTSNNATGGIYRDMLSNQTADMISSSGTLGLARQLDRELSSRCPADPKTAQSDSPT